MSSGRILLAKKWTAREIGRTIGKKCVNPAVMFSFPHAASLNNRYSYEVIEKAIDAFPDDYKGLHPVRLLEGIIKRIIVKDPSVPAAAPDNVKIAEQVQSLIRELGEE